MSIAPVSSPTITGDQFAQVTDAFFEASLDEVPSTVSAQRCIDWLLDLYQSDERVKVRRLIGEVIEDIRLIATIDSPETEDLVLGAMASVQAAIEMANELGRW